MNWIDLSDGTHFTPLTPYDHFGVLENLKSFGEFEALHPPRFLQSHDVFREYTCKA
jgi:hypothetical protein